MLWLIWIAIMLLTPILAGIGVWWENRTTAEPTLAETSSEPLQA